MNGRRDHPDISAGMAGGPRRPVDPPLMLETAPSRDGTVPRQLAIYRASAGYDLVDELDHLATRTIEPNLFFNPRFLAPAMPRLEADREVRLAVIRDGSSERGRLRLLAPFTVERVPRFGRRAMRIWSSPFSPLGTPLVDGDDPQNVLDDFISILTRPQLALPRTVILPDIRRDGPFAVLLSKVARARGLPLARFDQGERPVLKSASDGETYLRDGLRAHHLRGYRRLERRLAERGNLEHRVAVTVEEARLATEAFLSLEASGWKGRGGTAMALDRHRAAFMREAIAGLSARGLCRIHELRLDGRVIASLVVFVEAGVAYTWKTTFDENFSAYSPGTLIMLDATRSILDAPGIMMGDSCAVPGHPLMGRLWREREPMATLVLGLDPQEASLVDRTLAALRAETQLRGLARQARTGLRRLLGKRRDAPDK